MSTHAEKAAGKDPLAGVLAEAADEVVAAAEETGGYAYRYESFQDGSHAAVFTLGPGEEVQVVTFEDGAAAAKWHPDPAVAERIAAEPESEE